MSRILIIIAFFAFLTGCCGVSQDVKDEIHLNYERCKKYVELIDSKQTTPIQDQEFIKANKKAWAAMDYKINDNEEAKKEIE